MSEPATITVHPRTADVLRRAEHHLADRLAELLDTIDNGKKTKRSAWPEVRALVWQLANLATLHLDNEETGPEEPGA